MSRDDPNNILVPSEFQAMKDAPLPPHHKISSMQRNMWLDVMVFTGMRYKELLFLDGAIYGQNQWSKLFDSKNNAIILPKAYTKTNQDRTVHLTPTSSRVLSAYLREFKTLGLPTKNGMNDNLKRWWMITIEEEYRMKGKPVPWQTGFPTIKTFRKSWESWLLMAGHPIHQVAMSQGHTVAVSEHHYANLSPRLKSELDAVKRLTEGWHT